MAYSADELPKRDAESGDSDMVLIDLEGDREEFIIGYYDFIEKDWFGTDGDGILVDKSMRWMYLPLAKYDTK